MFICVRYWYGINATKRGNNKPDNIRSSILEYSIYKSKILVHLYYTRTYMMSIWKNFFARYCACLVFPTGTLIINSLKRSNT